MIKPPSPDNPQCPCLHHTIPVRRTTATTAVVKNVLHNRGPRHLLHISIHRLISMSPFHVP
jgi:hypothetical protein